MIRIQTTVATHLFDGLDIVTIKCIARHKDQPPAGKKGFVQSDDRNLPGNELICKSFDDANKAKAKNMLAKSHPVACSSTATQ